MVAPALASAVPALSACMQPRLRHRAPVAARKPVACRPRLARTVAKAASAGPATAVGVVEREGLSFQDFEELIKSYETPVVVDFYATWCGPCKLMAKHMQIIEPTLRGKCAFLKINGDLNIGVVKTLKISKLPTVTLYRGNGSTDVVATHTGMFSAQDLELWVREHLQLRREASPEVAA